MDSLVESITAADSGQVMDTSVSAPNQTHTQNNAQAQKKCRFDGLSDEEILCMFPFHDDLISLNDCAV